MDFIQNISIKGKTAIFSIALLLVIAVSVLFSTNIEGKQKLAFEKLGTTVNRVEQKITPLDFMIKNIKLNVVQVQQFITDISATRGLDGLDDGFDKAAKKDKAFKANMASALGFSQELNKIKITKALKVVKRDFSTYYATGKKMARAYIKYGPEGGNKMRNDFDVAAGQIDKSLDILLSESEKLNKDSAKSIKRDLLVLEGLNNKVLRSSIISAAFLIAILGLTVFMLYFTITKPVESIYKSITKLSNGDYNEKFIYAKNTDEMGLISQALDSFKIQLSNGEKMREDQKLTAISAEKEKKQTMLDLADSFEQEVSGVISTVTSSASSMEKAATSMSANAKQTSEKTHIVANAADNASSNVSAVAGAAEELSASINEISTQVTNSTQVSREAKDKAHSTSEKVQGLVDSVEKIGQVVSLISDIAEQTNLLALNATIEAARAGEAGKGFAVVASEVKNLAAQTAKATEEISGQIGDIQTATKESNSAIQEILEVIERIDQITGTVAAAVEEQGAATSEIARNVSRAAEGTDGVSSNIEEVTHAATETGTAAQSVLTSAQDLTKQADILSSAVNNILARIRNS